MIHRLLNFPLAALNRGRFQHFQISPSADIQLSRIRGSRDCSLFVGDESNIRAYITFQRPTASVRIGSRTFVGKSWIMAANEVTIGDDVLISWGVTIVDNNSHSVRYSERVSDVSDWTRGHKNWEHVKSKAVNIESKSWIGFGAAILSGVTIGTGAVIGACSVIAANVPPWTVWAGNPGRLVRELSADER